MGKIKQWIISHKFISIIAASVLTVGVALSVALPLTLSHKHVYGESWEYNETGHYHECECGHKSKTEGHNWGEEAYENSSPSCHTFMCSICGYVKEEDHEFESDTSIECLVCGYTRTETTLSFKSGSYSTKTYNGEVQTFDKASLVSTNASLDSVIVEYSKKGTAEKVWTTEPKEAGDYYIRLRVEADNIYTAASVDTLEDEGKILRISPKTLSLENLVLVYTESELGTASQTTLTLTSKDIDGLCGSDTLQVNLYKRAGASFSAGDVLTIREYSNVASGEEKTVGLQAKGNYRFSNEATGKLYVANRTTDKTNNIQEKHESGSVHIDQNGRAYYYAVLSRARRNDETEGEPYATYYSPNCTNGAVKVIDAFTRSASASAKLTEDGQLLVYGTSYDPVVIIGVEYKGTETAGVNNTFTLVESILTRTVDSTAWGNALTFAEGGYKVTLKKNGTTIEESKYYSPTSNFTHYYRKDADGETYFSVESGENYQYYIFEQNEGVWTRRSLTADYDADEANADAMGSIKLNEEWLKNIISAEAFANFTYSLEDLMYHTDVEYTLNGITASHIAIRFAGGKLSYVEFTSGDDKYTIEVVNTSSSVWFDLPIKGSSKEGAVAIPYSTSTFALNNVNLFEGDNWFVIDVTAEILGSSADISGTLTTADTSKITSIVVTDASGSPITDIDDDVNVFSLENLTTGKYYINVKVSEGITGSWDIGVTSE